VPYIRSDFVLCQRTNFVHFVLQLGVGPIQSARLLKPVWTANVQILARTHNVEWMQYVGPMAIIELAAIVRTIIVAILLYSAADPNVPATMNVHTT
jgi:hypothetical protein